MLRAAFERLSFRSRRKKQIKYDLVIEQQRKQKSDKNDTDSDLDKELLKYTETKHVFKNSKISKKLFPVLKHLNFRHLNIYVDI